MELPNTALLQASKVARSLVGDAVDVRKVTRGGRNSRIWRVRSGGREFALKQYPPRSSDTRDRLATETAALRLMEWGCIDSVPRVLGTDRERGYALMTWIDGSDVIEVRDEDIDAAARFLAAVHGLRLSPWAADQPLASEACLCGLEIERQIETRLARLWQQSAETELVGFLRSFVRPAVEQATRRARSEIAAAGLDFSAHLPQEWRSLAPSDFGFHNSLRRNDGSLAFVDFEYFGWDDPVKLTADILLHPARTLSGPQRIRFRRIAIELYGADPAFACRLQAYMPLFGLRWVLIMLNEFIPERWKLRSFSGEVGDWSETKRRQLARARSFLRSLPEKLED